MSRSAIVPPGIWDCCDTVPVRTFQFGEQEADLGLTLRRWMTVVGAIYVLMGLRLLPWINGAMIEAGLGDAAAPGIDIVSGTAFFEFAVDWMGILGLDLIVLGGVLLYAARTDPVRHRLLVVVVVWQEAIRGVAADVWIMNRDYASVGFYVGFILFHLVLIVTGLRVLQTTRAARVEATT